MGRAAIEAAVHFRQALGESLPELGYGRESVFHRHSTALDPALVRETRERMDATVTGIAAAREQKQINATLGPQADIEVTVIPLNHGRTEHIIRHQGQAPDAIIVVPRPHRGRNGATHTVFNGELHDNHTQTDVRTNKTPPHSAPQSIHIPRPR